MVKSLRHETMHFQHMNTLRKGWLSFIFPNLEEHPKALEKVCARTAKQQTSLNLE